MNVRAPDPILRDDVASSYQDKKGKRVMIVLAFGISFWFRRSARAFAVTDVFNVRTRGMR